MLARFTLGGLQPTRMPSANACSQCRKRQRLQTCRPSTDPPANASRTHSRTQRRSTAGHTEQRRASFRRRSTQPTQREQTANAANGSTAKRQPLHLKHSPTIKRRKARLNQCRQFRPPGQVQPPQFAPTGQRFSAFSAGYLRTIPAARGGTLARLLAYLCTNECIFAYSQRKLYTIFDMCPESLDFTGFQGLHFMHSPKKVFTLENRTRKALIFLHLRALHNQPICAKTTIYHYINSNLCGSMV